ncbi:MAG: Virginiamycin B lyase [Syntrophus sp. SKADARSKE-3]|nr:Virginiamycin B lyase [Syntrophus sp. SKADARSKE-3]
MKSMLRLRIRKLTPNKKRTRQIPVTKTLWIPALCLALIAFISWGLPAVVHATPYAYITNSGDNTVSVIDTATNTVKVTVPVGLRPLGVAVHPQGKYVYIANFTGNTVSVIDVANNHTVINTIPVGNNPYGIAVNPAGTYAYVANSTANTVSVIDVTRKFVTTVIPVPGGPLGVAVSPSGTFVYVTGNQNNTLSVIDTTTNSVKTTITVGQQPLGVIVAPSGAYVYTVNTASNSVSVINTSTYAIAATITNVGITTPWGIAINPAGTLGYITSYGGNRVTVFDTSTNLVTNNINVGTNPIGATVNIAGTYAYIVNNGSGNVSVLDTITNTVLTTIPVGNNPYGLGVFTAPFGPSPSVSSTLPSAGAAGISIGTYIQATFTYAIDPFTYAIDPLSAMDPSTINSSTFLVSGGVTGTITYDSVNRIATFKPTSILLKNTPYTVTLTTGVKNMAGNALAANYTWSFTTTNDNSSSGCFIATAAYGSYDDAQVKILRAFRDKYLLTNPWGEAMVRFYYKHSPPIADTIRSYPALKAPVRWALAPIVFGIQYPSMIALMLGLVVIGGNRLNQRRRTR